jgi:hypothetical protein
VQSKISRLQAQYKTVYDWKNCTGKGLMKSESDVATINCYIRKICPYFEDLNPIMELICLFTSAERVVSLFKDRS